MAGRPLRLAMNVGKTLALSHVMMEYGFFMGPASGPSMLPTFQVAGESILVDHRYRYGRNVLVGDLVHFKIPIFPESDGIKRVIGMPGDYVMLGSPDAEKQKMIQVPQGHCWVVGDNLEASRDSRLYGPVPLALIRGKAVNKPWWLALLAQGGTAENGLRDVRNERE
ncbi:peptidase S24/S26A/S26B/S26C [Colletotrichum godetiae]|uniref:Peptidase S24/S26A/S26B/S26C n=1 Tax=Colletotrichum godetiae TaxID=1209918 RepID=A0AAJ0API4_9PEZI|nr:peptidase S24/S26A/S26B/S26C [Colletotrichum godetiae]KAK1688004.1 peptidase S24/S26A/S26B/S26C [Colletotrichum godetiae]